MWVFGTLGPLKKKERKEMQFGPQIEPHNIHMSFSHYSLDLMKDKKKQQFMITTPHLSIYFKKYLSF